MSFSPRWILVHPSTLGWGDRVLIHDEATGHSRVVTIGTPKFSNSTVAPGWQAPIMETNRFGYPIKETDDFVCLPATGTSIELNVEPA